jgi:MFS family permease
VAGCLISPRLVGAVGHIRTFGVMCALAAVSVLIQALIVDAWAWIPVRAVSGFCFAGAAMIVESWLNDRAEPSTRGAIFGVYTMVNLAAATAGQMAISARRRTGFLFFAVAAIVYCLALVPTALSTSASPAPLTSVRLDLRGALAQFARRGGGGVSRRGLQRGLRDARGGLCRWRGPDA